MNPPTSGAVATQSPTTKKAVLVFEPKMRGLQPLALPLGYTATQSARVYMELIYFTEKSTDPVGFEPTIYSLEGFSERMVTHPFVALSRLGYGSVLNKIPMDLICLLK